LNPKDLLAHFALGNAYQALGQMDEALPAWRAARAGSKFVELGQQRLEQDDWDGAIMSYREAVALQPQNWKAWWGLGKTLWRGRRDFEGALNAYWRMMEFPEAQTIAYLEIGHLYKEQKAWDEANTWYQRALETDRSSVWPYIAIGSLYSDQAMWAEAMNWYDRARAVAPQSQVPDNAVAMTLVQRADQARQAGLLDEAIIWYLAALRYRDFALHNWYPHSAIGEIYNRRGEWEKAVPHFQEAIRVAPEVAWPYVHLGDAYSALGHRDEAIAAYRRALELDPRYNQARESLQRLLNP